MNPARVQAAARFPPQGVGDEIPRGKRELAIDGFRFIDFPWNLPEITEASPETAVRYRINSGFFCYFECLAGIVKKRG
jgi:hypothetical protein